MKNLRPSKILDDSFNKNKGIGQKRKKEELLMQIFQISVSRYVKKNTVFLYSCSFTKNESLFFI